MPCPYTLPLLRPLRLYPLSFVLFVTFVVKTCSHLLRPCRVRFVVKTLCILRANYDNKFNGMITHCARRR
jgi:hypothetical protein